MLGRRLRWTWLLLGVVQSTAACTGEGNEPGVDVELTSPGHQGVALSSAGLVPVGDTYVMHKRKHRNYGSEAVLRLGHPSKEQALVRFDSHEIDGRIGAGILVSASLEFGVVHNGLHGRSTHELHVHRMLQGWKESSATWNCADDLDLANHKDDCTSDNRWKMGSAHHGPSIAEPTATATVPAGAPTTVALDVTDDVQAFLAGEANHGWLLRVDGKKHRPLLGLGSKESYLPPTLVLTVDHDGCTPQNCSDAGRECGALWDSCGNPIQCGDCDEPDTCGGGGAANLCGCTPRTCEQLGVQCGTVSDGCAGILECGTCSTHQATMDTLVRQHRPNQPGGDQALLRLKGHRATRALVAFDPVAMAQAGATGPLGSATLELQVAAIGDAKRREGTLDVHALSQAWTESGATWKCAIDTEPGDHDKDCGRTTRWKMGGKGPHPWISEPTASVVIGPEHTGPVALDVTADVAAELAGVRQHLGWVIKWRKKTKKTWIDLKARESGDGPTLTLSVDGDRDGDGTPDSQDGCADDSNKTEAGICGCGISDITTDGNPCTDDICGPTKPPLPMGTSCPDDDLCNGDETCDEAGTCLAGTPPVADDGNACTVDACEPATGVIHTPLPAGTSCLDGDLCNGSETCDGLGSCWDGEAPVLDDGNPCTADACDPATGVSHTPLAAGSSCLDDDVCNGDETCAGAGTCLAGTPPVADDGNACTADACEPATGVIHTPLPAGTSCLDGDLCNGSETCDGLGSCWDGEAPVLDDGNPCTADACDPATGVSHTPLAAGSSCLDDDVCNGDETCDGAGTCLAGTPPVTEDGNACTADACEPATGVIHTPLPAGTPCDDGNACTQTDSCQAGDCTGSNPVECTALDQCHTVGTCDTATGVCSNSTRANGFTCDDGDPCTVNDICTEGACQAGTNLAQTYTTDEDGDKHGSPLAVASHCNAPLANQILVTQLLSVSDCHDGDRNIHPDAADICNDIDDDCDGNLEEDCFATIRHPTARIVFCSERGANMDIYSVADDGIGLTRLTDNPAYDLLPAVSQDGKTIAFVSNRDGNDEIYMMSAAGTDKARLTNHDATDLSPSWAPVGDRLTFSSNRDGDMEIYTMSSDGTNVVQLTFNDVNDIGPSWSPVDNRIAFASDRDGDWEIYVMNIDGTDQLRITHADGTDLYPAWSPTDSRIAFMSTRTGNPEIFVTFADGSSPVQLTVNDAFDWEPTWSPDGNRLIFASGQLGTFGRDSIFMMSSDGSNLVRLTAFDYNDGFPSAGPMH